GDWMRGSGGNPGRSPVAGTAGAGESRLAEVPEPVALRHLGVRAAVSAAVVFLPQDGIAGRDAIGGLGEHDSVYGGTSSQRDLDRVDFCGSAVLYRDVSKIPEHLSPGRCAYFAGHRDRLQFSESSHAPHASRAVVLAASVNPLTDIDAQRRAGTRAVPTPGPGWFRLLVPSVSDLICISLFVSLAVALARRLLGDAGVGWHIRTGEWILRTGSVPRVDLFSSLTNGKPWFAWEWLYDAGMGVVHRGLGLNGVVAFSALVIAFTFALVFRMMRERGTSLPVAVAVLLLAVSASSIHFLARPHIVSWLLTVIWFGILEAFEQDGDPRRLFWLPVTMLVWVNLHGGFLVGFLLLGIYGIGAAVRGWRAGRDWHSVSALSIAAGAAFALTFVNPYGYQLHTHIYRYLGDRFL